MTVDIQEKIEGIRKVLKVYAKVSKRLPSTYPRPSLVVHLSEEELEKYFETFYEYKPKNKVLNKDYIPYAFCDANSNVVHVHATMAEQTAKRIAWYLLHEIGHLFADQKYGQKDPRTNDEEGSRDEDFANQFAWRWTKRMKDEGMFD